MVFVATPFYTWYNQGILVFRRLIIIKERYWKLYHDIIHKENYYRYYLLRSQRIASLSTIGTVLVSASSVSAWLLWDFAPFSWLFALLTMLAQAWQAISPHLPFAKQESSLVHISPELRSLSSEISSTWRKMEFNQYSEAEIEALITDYRIRYDGLVRRYIPTLIPMPLNKKCQKQAEADTEIYFRHFYGAEDIEPKT